MLHSMGVGQRKLVPFWVLALALTCSQHTGKIQSVQLFQAIWRDIFLLPCPGLRWAVSFRVLSGSWQAKSICEWVLLCSPCPRPDNFKWSLT